ncbi:MAG: NAD+ synthase [Gemmatimonadetes bacterium]|nr:NAD+ synthase [Gemmatimonadota bacterium]
MIRPPGGSHLRVGLAQFKPKKADVAFNLARIRDVISEQAGSVDLLVFPETSVTGYFLEGGVAEAARSAMDIATELGEPPPEAPDVVLGFFERHRSRLYNSVVYLTPGERLFEATHVHRKMFLPTYGVFDEARFVEPGKSVQSFDTRFARVGLLICEEMWHSLPPTILAVGGAELIIAVSASPARGFAPGGEGRPQNLSRWDALAPATALEHGVFVVVSQLVGSEGGKVFPGGSIAVGPDGSILARGPLFEAGVTVAELDSASLARARAASPLLADLERTLPHLQRALINAQSPAQTATQGPNAPAAPSAGSAEAVLEPGAPRAHAPVRPEDETLLDLDLPLVESALLEFIREEVVRQRGFERVVIGLSGGVDSSVSLLLAVRALGPENVTGFRLPYATSSQESLDHADLIVEVSDAECRTIEITESVDAYVQKHEPDLSPLRRGNLAARLRSVILFDQSAKLGALPLGTGNKSERLLGYYTWHADDSPPINPLGDLFKTQVWDLARHLGVPDVIIDKPASADLVRGVNDEDELGISYRRADPILHWLLHGYTADELKSNGFLESDVDCVWRRLSATHWKRELPTVAMLSSTAIGEFYLRPVDY